MVVGVHKERLPARREGGAIDGIAVVLGSDDSLSTHCIQDRLVLASGRKRDQRTEVTNVFECHN